MTLKHNTENQILQNIRFEISLVHCQWRLKYYPNFSSPRHYSERLDHKPHRWSDIVGRHGNGPLRVLFDVIL